MRVSKLCGAVALVVALFGQARASENATQTQKETRVVTQAIAHATKYEVSRTVGPGRMVQAQQGRNGYIKTTYEITRLGNRVLSKERKSQLRVAPVDAIYRLGKAGNTLSRGSFVRSKVRVMSATAYDPSAGRGSRATFRTATGRRAGYGVAAVDPRIIPLGTQLFIEGYGFAIAADTGGAIKGNKIDLCVPTYREAMLFGRKQVRVHILSGR